MPNIIKWRDKFLENLTSWEKMYKEEMAEKQVAAAVSGYAPEIAVAVRKKLAENRIKVGHKKL
ncbi:MAG: hypothetical protein LBP22_17135 [Deltaproteobacteria bacterium]|jgi:uncharacterized Zn finger protein|nr:hypothetical protein [Deltaproteobacteria bacterium]